MRWRGRLTLTLVALVTLALLSDAAAARPWGWLGVRIRDLSEPEMEELAKRHGIREGFGVVIVEVLESTPASVAGLRNGDIVVAFNGRPVTETRLLQRLIAAAPMDAETRLTILRTTGRSEFPVRLALMPRDVMGDRVAAEFGFVLREPAPPAGDAAAAPLLATPAVVAVLQGSVAEQAGLRVGDVLLEVEGRSVLSRESAREALSDTPVDRPLRVSIRRGAERLSLTLAAP